MTNDGTHSYTYDPEGNIIKVDNGSTATYVYNATNQRVNTTVGSAQTDIVFNANGQRDSEYNAAISYTTLKAHYYWGSKPVAFYTVDSNGVATLHYQHQDWLGTERMRTSSNRVVEGTYTSLPWGDSLTQTTPGGSDQDASHFATLDHDAESNTDHAEFRQYSNTQGRFMSPDPYDGSFDPSNPQSFNRYEYAMNNPLGNIDPTGLLCGWEDWGTSPTEEGDCGGGAGMYNLPPIQVWAPMPDGGPGVNPPPPTCDMKLLSCQMLYEQWLASLNKPPQFPSSQSQGSGSSAPNNGPSKKQQCALQTLKKDGVSLALDAAGFIPGESQTMAIVQLGVSGASLVNSLVAGAQANAANDNGGVINAGIGATSSIVGGQITGVGMAAKSMGVSWAKAVPWVGYGVNALATLNDLSSAYGDYKACMSHP